MLDETVAVIENRPLTGGHFLLSLRSPHQAPLVRPGQFAMLRLPGHSDVLLRRPMSIYDVKLAHPQGSGKGKGNLPEIIQLLYKIVGRGTQLMAELRPGDQTEMLAPLGHGFFEEKYLEAARQADEVLHVAGGIGIAALLMPAKSLARAGIRQRLFFGARGVQELVGTEDFVPFVGETILSTEDGSCGTPGYITRPLEAHLENHRHQRFLLLACGPWAMLEATAEMACRHGCPCLVSMENRMGCGLGVCLGCSIRVRGEGHGSYERVCTEGPVFWAKHVMWERK